MLDPLVLVPVAVLASLGLLSGARPRLAGLAATGAALVIWLAMVPPAERSLAPRLAAAGIEAAPVWIALAIALTAFVLFRYVLRVALVRDRRPRMRSRLAGLALGAVEGSAVAATLLLVLVLAEPGALRSQTAAATYPVVHALAGRAAPEAPRPVAAALASLPEPTPRVAEVPAEPPRPVPWVRIESEEDGTLTRLFTGTVRAGERAPLAFEVGGTVARVTVRVGETVSAGQVLATLDDTTLRLAMDERRAALVEVEAVLRETELNFGRQSTLLERDVVAPAAVDNARAALDSARARRDAARSALARAEEALDDAELRAPFAGRIASQLVEPSEVVAAGAPVFEIEDADATLEVVVNVPEGVVDELAVGQRQALLGRADEAGVSATVTEIGSRRPGEATFPVTLEVAADGAPTLRPGSTRRIALDVSLPASEGVRVPAAAVVAGADGGAHVFALGDAGPEPGGGIAVARRVPVHLMAFEGDAARIATDLAPGTPIAARGAAFLDDGQEVALIGVGVDRFEEFDGPTGVASLMGRGN